MWLCPIVTKILTFINEFPDSYAEGSILGGAHLKPSNFSLLRNIPEQQRLEVVGTRMKHAQLEEEELTSVACEGHVVVGPEILVYPRGWLAG